MDKIEVYEAVEDGQVCIGLRVHDENANLQDLLDAWQPLCDDSLVYKKYAPGNHSVCKGCQINCCHTAYVIPDLISLKKMCAWWKCDYETFIARFMQPEKLEAGLLRMQPDPCVFLENDICTIYPVRSLICRFYLCADLLGETQELIYSITWAGITAAQLFAEQHGLLRPNPLAGRSSFDLMLQRLVEQYRYSNKITPFLDAGEYADIPLKPFVK